MTGFYNLPSDEQDRYNQTDIDYKAFYENNIKQKVKRVTKTLAPTTSESLSLYITRLRANLDQLDEQSQQEHMYGPKGPWYVHKRAQNCFICDYSTMLNQQMDILMDLEKFLPKKLSQRLSFASTKEGSQRLTLTP